MIDLHTHMTYFWDRTPGTRPLNQPRRPAGVTTVLAAENARKTLDTGVTTVRDLGASGDVDYAMRDLINMGKMVGPRMFVAGQGLSAPRADAPKPDYRQLAESRVAAGSDWVKVYGSRGSYQSVDTTQTLTFDEMKAAVDGAHAKGRPVAIHSYGASGVKDAVRAGADSIEHGIELDDETIAEMVKRGTVWVPTIDHNRYYVDAKDEFGFAPETIPPLQAYIEKNLESTRRAFKAGVKLGMGSDAVYTMFGQNTRELAWFVKAGMTPGAGAGDGDDDSRGPARPRQRSRRDRAGLLRRPRRRRRRPARRHRGRDRQGPLGDEGRHGRRRSHTPGRGHRSAEREGRRIRRRRDPRVRRALPAQPRRSRGRQGRGRSRAEVADRHLAPASADGSAPVEWLNSEQPGDEWIAAMRRNTSPTIFREPLTNVIVTIDSDHLAHVRADFQVLRDGKAVSHGVDQFTLVREPSGWKFVVIAYTSIPIP